MPRHSSAQPPGTGCTVGQPVSDRDGSVAVGWGGRGENRLAFRRFERWLYRGHRPNAVARALNRAWAAVNALGIAPNHLVSSEVVGRRSGRAISFPLVMAVVTRSGTWRLGAGGCSDATRSSREGETLGGHGRALASREDRTEPRLEEVPVEKRGPVLKAYLKRAPGARAHLAGGQGRAARGRSGRSPRTPVFRVQRQGRLQVRTGSIQRRCLTTVCVTRRDRVATAVESRGDVERRTQGELSCQRARSIRPRSSCVPRSSYS